MFMMKPSWMTGFKFPTRYNESVQSSSMHLQMSRWDWRSWYFTNGTGEARPPGLSWRPGRTRRPGWSDGPWRTSASSSSEKKQKTWQSRVKSRVQGPAHSKNDVKRHSVGFTHEVYSCSAWKSCLLVMMSRHLVGGAMVVQREWVVLSPPRYPLSPLVDCWLSAGINVPLLTAWSGTGAARFRHSGMPGVISVQMLTKPYGKQKQACKDVREESSLPLIQWHLFCCSCQRSWCSSDTLYEGNEGEFSFSPTACINASSLASFLLISASSL